MPEIQMPKLSDTMTEGTLVAWKKKKGDKVSAGDVLAEIETDKATMEWESPEDGTLAEIYVEEGGKVNVGDRIAFIGEEGEETPKEDAKPKEQKKEEDKPKEANSEKKQESEYSGKKRTHLTEWNNYHGLLTPSAFAKSSWTEPTCQWSASLLVFPR